MNRTNVMNRHALRIASRWVFFALIAAAGCASTQGADDPTQLSANQEWVERACKAELFDPTGWPRYQYYGVQISVPEPYKQTSTNPNFLYVRTSQGSLLIRRHREARYDFDQYYNAVRPGQVSCAITYGGLPAEVVAWRYAGEFITAIRVPPQWSGDDSDKWLFAVARSRDLSQATMLRHVLRTIAAIPVTEKQEP
jgi:hypothetical protein